MKTMQNYLDLRKQLDGGDLRRYDKEIIAGAKFLYLLRENCSLEACFDEAITDKLRIDIFFKLSFNLYKDVIKHYLLHLILRLPKRFSTSKKANTGIYHKDDWHGKKLQLKKDAESVEHWELIQQLGECKNEGEEDKIIIKLLELDNERYNGFDKKKTIRANTKFKESA